MYGATILVSPHSSQLNYCDVFECVEAADMGAQSSNELDFTNWG